MMDFRDMEKKIRRCQIEYDQSVVAAEKERKIIDTVFKTKESLEEARQIVQSIAEDMQQRAHNRIARVVTRCLAAVFDDPYEFQIRFEQKRGKTEAVLGFTRDGERYTDPLNELGGGVLDVAALALRLSCVMVSRPPAERTFILDEPWANVRGEENKKRTRNMLNILAEEFKVQWIINTDVESYRLGRIIDLTEQRTSGG